MNVRPDVAHAAGELGLAVGEVQRRLEDLQALLPAGHVLVIASMGLVAMPPFPRCVALTTRGQRCASPVFAGQPYVGGRDVLVFTADELALQTQRCPVHVERVGCGQDVDVEWELVDDEPANNDVWMRLAE